jgi:PAS domain S-box-containing protein
LAEIPDGFFNYLSDMNSTAKPKTSRKKVVIPSPDLTIDFYKTILESLKDYCVFTTDKNGLITSWNKAGLKTFGYKDKDIIGKNASILFTVSDRRKKTPEKELKKAYKNAEALDERLHLKKDKSLFWGSVLVFPLKDSKNNCIGFTKIIRDLTDKKIQELELKNERNKLKEIFNRMPAFLSVRKGPTHVYVLVNKAYETIVGHRKLIGKTVAEALPELKRQSFIKSLDNVYKTGKPYIGKEVKVLLQKKSNSPLEERFVDVVYQAYRNSNGEIEGVLAHGYDVTDTVLTRKKIEESEEKLRQNDKRLREVVEELKLEKNKLVKLFEKASAFMIILRGKDHVFEMVNKSYLKLIGHREILGKPVAEALPEVVKHGYIDILDKVYKTGEPFIANGVKVYFLRIPGKPEEKRYLNLLYQPYKDRSGKIAGIFAHGYDITEEVIARKRLEQSEAALKHSEERLQQLADSMPQIVWTTGPDGIVDYYNKQWYKYTGFKKGKEDWDSMIHPDDRKRVLNTWDESVQTGRPYQVEYRFKDRKTDTYKWFLARGLPIRNDKGEITRWIGTYTEIHQLKELQRQKDDFLAIASHELKTPVTTIKAYGQMLEHMFRQRGDQKAAEMLHKMDTQINKLTDLIGDLLDVTRIESGKLQLNKSLFDFNGMVSENVHEIQHTANHHRIITQFEPVGEVFADKDRLGQVVVNFLTNAIKYSPHADSIIVQTEKQKNNVVLSVQDFGMGIAKENIYKVFDQFYRVNENMLFTFPGMGLGLYICAELIKRHGGKIWVKSIEGKGATFFFSVPIK